MVACERCARGCDDDDDDEQVPQCRGTMLLLLRWRVGEGFLYAIPPSLFVDLCRFFTFSFVYFLDFW